MRPKGKTVEKEDKQEHWYYSLKTADVQDPVDEGKDG